MKVIIGLGNPGSQYAHTRHNIGFLLLDGLVKHFNFQEFYFKEKFKAELSQGSIEDEKIIFAKPQTYMNLSGFSAQTLLQFYGLSPQNLLVVHDDKDLELGIIKYTEQSSSAGHRGVQDIIDKLGTDAFFRIRIGVGPVPPEMETDAYVLQNFTPSEKRKLNDQLPDIIQHIYQFINTPSYEQENQ